MRTLVPISKVTREKAKADMERIYDHYRPLGLQGYHKDQFAVPEPKSEK